MKRTVIVSDFSGRVIEDEKDHYVITVTPKDRRKSVFTLDAHSDDKVITEVQEKGRPVIRRGRKPVNA